MENIGLTLTVIVTYLVLLMAWGVYQGRKVKTGSGYSIAGRNLPGWAAALSERATGESSWALLGLPGAAYAGGLLFTIVWRSAGMEPILTARVATFGFSMLTAGVATVALPRARNARPDGAGMV
jgi:Na+/proline symporter